MTRKTIFNRSLELFVHLCIAFVFCLAVQTIDIGLCHPSAKAEPAASSGPLEILRISPSGEDSPGARQIVFHFNKPVVPLGRMERDASEIPIAIEPKLNCQWLWLNPSTLACQLDDKDAMKPATRYTAVIEPSFTALDGSKLAGRVTHSFTTARPKVTSTWFKTWLAPGMPQIGVRFNQPVEEATVAKHLIFQAGADHRVTAEVSEDPDYAKSSDYKKGLIYLVSPADEFPADEEVSLMVTPGIQSLIGPEPGIERRTLVSFHTFPEFAFKGIECETNSGEKIVLHPSDPLGSQPRCNPTRRISLLFSSPVLKEEVQKGVRIVPELTSERPERDPWSTVYSYSRLSSPHKKGQLYRVPLPDAIKPFADYQLKASPGMLKDEFGRPLGQGFQIGFRTDHLLPDLYLVRNLPVLEKGLDTIAPLWVTNLDRIELDAEVFTVDERRPRREETLAVPKIQDVPFVMPLGVRDLIGKPSGAVRGTITATSPPIRDWKPSRGWFFAQVTPFAVHVKLGHFNTLVWVTDLRSGQPVENVAVEVRKQPLSQLGEPSEVLSKGTTNSDGIATLAGTSKIDPELKLLWNYKFDEPRLVVHCGKGEDLAVLPLTYDFRVDAEGANREYIPDWLRNRYGHIRSWGTTAQGIYKVGDTVQYKIYVRDQNNRSLVLPPGCNTKGGDSSHGGSYTLTVIDPMDKAIYQRKGFRLSQFGACDGEFVIPKNGAVGWYRFQLSASFTKESWEPLRVLVSDFTPSPFKVKTELNGKSFQVEKTVKITTQARLHAGGPYANARAKITATLQPRPFKAKDPRAQGFEFDVLEKSDRFFTPSIQTVFQTEGTLDETGSLETEFRLAPSPVLYGVLTVESAVRDERGKFVAGRTSAAYFGRDRYVGALQKDWVLQEGKPAEFFVVVTDETGRLVEGIPVRIKTERKIVKASRVKGAGDAYVTQYVSEWVETSSDTLESGLEPQSFRFTPVHAGACRMSAEIRDTQGRVHKTTIQRWVVGRGAVVWESVQGNIMNVFPEKDEVRVGETVRFLAQNPFPGAKALITVERFGVMESWVQTFEKSAEIIEIPILPDYLPGFYLSVLVMSPRVDKPAESTAEDLGKPTFQMGYVRVPVKDPYKEIAVSVKPAKDEVKPQEEVTIDIQAVPRHWSTGDPSPPIELAVTVLDEAVFDLLFQGEKAFDPYHGFYSLDSLDLANFNLIMQLIGRQKLEKKGANPGGGGGADLTLRSLFKFVSYWNPSLPVDAEGKARIRFQVPDNLTAWRVLVMAVTPGDLMGLGSGLFRVNQAIEIRPVLPNQVTEGDRFDAGFSILNRTEKRRTLDITIEANGPIRKAGETADATATEHVTSRQELTLNPYERTIVRLPIDTTGAGKIVLRVRAADAEVQDGLQSELEVRKIESTVTSTSYGTTTEDETTETVLFPDNMRPGTGRLQVTVSPTVISGFEGAFRYLRGYPYSCWEQKITKGVAAAFYQSLKDYLGPGFTWPESAELPEKTLLEAAEYQAPNGAMTYYIPKNEYASPYLSAFTALAFNWMEKAGYSPPAYVKERLFSYLEDMLRHDITPRFYNKGMVETVRAVTLAALAEDGKVSVSDIQRYASHIDEMSLFGKALFLEAALKIPGTSHIQKVVLQKILVHANETGGTLSFSESVDSRYRMILSSPLRANCAILSSLLAYRAAHPAADLPADICLHLMRSIVQARKSRNCWPSTQENLFAVKALSDFSRLYEPEKPDMTVRVLLNEKVLGKAHFDDLANPPKVFSSVPEVGDEGSKETIRIERTGKGRLYYETSLAYTPQQLGEKSINAGIEVHREYSVERNGEWTLLKDPFQISGGDLVRVDLYLSLPAARYFVVVDDFVPGGLEPVSRDLATASRPGTGEVETFPEGSYGSRFTDWIGPSSYRWGFYHKELRHDAVRFYSEYLPRGRYHLSYTAQAIAPGEFIILPLRAEEMYEPDVYGRGIAGKLQISVSKSNED